MLIINITILNSIRQLKEFSASTNKTGQVILRILAAVLGGYGLTYSTLAALAILLPWPRVDVVFFSALFPSLVWLGGILWAFAAPTAQRAWRDMLGATAFCSLLAMVVVWGR
ncbi:hypothetical protein [Pelosinus sp. sgz500959]|uniref:hypothetical protein n=1 Tax=Pelosinus sp. sgz500959 TaxID=3242472 RepID=UPI0036713DAC